MQDLTADNEVVLPLSAPGGAVPYLGHNWFFNTATRDVMVGLRCGDLNLMTLLSGHSGDHRHCR